MGQSCGCCVVVNCSFHLELRKGKIGTKGFQKVSDFSWLGESNNERRPAWHLLQIQAMDDFTMNAMKDTGWASKCGTEGRRWQSGFFWGLVSYMLDSKYVSIYLYTIYDIYIDTYYIYDYTFVWFRVVFGGFQGLMFFIVNLQIQSWTFVVQAATS